MQFQQNKPKMVLIQIKDSEECHFCKEGGYIMKICIRLMRQLIKKGTDIITFINESLYINYATNVWWVDLDATIHVAINLWGFNMKILRRGKEILESLL